jgi:hypothetical protein
MVRNTAFAGRGPRRSSWFRWDLRLLAMERQRGFGLGDAGSSKLLCFLAPSCLDMHSNAVHICTETFSSCRISRVSSLIPMHHCSSMVDLWPCPIDESVGSSATVLAGSICAGNHVSFWISPGVARMDFSVQYGDRLIDRSRGSCIYRPNGRCGNVYRSRSLRS